MQPSTQHKLNWLSQFFHSKNIAIVGGYHYGNLGDMAMGLSVKEHLEHSGLANDLQTIYNLKKWPKRKYNILGGGAIGYQFCLNQIYKRINENTDHLGIIGVDFNENSYPNHIINLLEKAAYVSARSLKQANYLSSLTKRTDIISMPDLAFAYKTPDFKQIRNQDYKNNPPKRLLFNMVPLYGQLVGKKVIPSKQYTLERPEIIYNHKAYLETYISFIKSHIYKAIEEEIDIIHIPFTPSDEAFAKLIFPEKQIIHLPYSSNPKSLLYRINPTDNFISTRFHATLFAIRAGAAVLPIAYARKNEELLHELGWKHNEYYHLSIKPEIHQMSIDFKRVDFDQIDKMEFMAINGINRCLEQLKLKVNV